MDENEKIYLSVVVPLFNEEESVEKLFYEIVRASFGQRRKTLVNNLHNKYSIPKTELIEILIEANLNPQARAESLSVADFIDLSDILYSYM